MKERIVIPKDKIKVLTSCGHFPTNGYFTFEKEDVEVEQVPETWEELKELCEDLESKDVFITSGGDSIEFHNLWFWKDGTVCYNREDIKICVTVSRMWNIIKNLIGEEK